VVSPPGSVAPQARTAELEQQRLQQEERQGQLQELLRRQEQRQGQELRPRQEQVQLQELGPALIEGPNASYQAHIDLSPAPADEVGRRAVL
jgi:hypothetical protein